MSEQKEYLALGSIVILKGAIKKVMIISRGNILNDQYYDYGAILYPEGMVDENIAYFNETDIIKVIHEGFRDEDDALILTTLSDAYAEYEAQAEDQPEATEEILVDEAVVSDDPFAQVRDWEE
ncbi:MULTISPECIES: DUF4176 domain-containing protein [unclassified Enterococcus]|uniref:DUF4176 domain-containing protein n=1 Tax=unclassified Enterococcus TaxID=2608891 RepID=UPI0015574C64|nr:MULTISPECIES: DUF4176 domain-containing protein [unclassified Enterococcus]MBS7576416.1 DUF4176 domain-containing protein [Enterococcus sp. MMGLQ5-2]MBS7583648.1 DUF4176 domain-containing protein [Enterococcus sp. MMGLQ5-1]NPD11509.1 DUF4176 domain-containing protein [Enterococcus sp. MMGLQ5-1]NPD36253.1 DUF4176 domain-containing protein [Enterococcus sp. MMGLQ5-2]